MPVPGTVQSQYLPVYLVNIALTRVPGTGVQYIELECGYGVSTGTVLLTNVLHILKRVVR